MRLTFPAVLALAGLMLAGCATPPDTALAPPSAPASPAAATPSSPTSGPSALAPVEAPPTSWVMPNLVGANLQDAQNEIQALTDFGIAITTSTDATGAGRFQVVDSNWQVCSQNVPPGAEITSTTDIDFGAVKLDESC